MSRFHKARELVDFVLELAGRRTGMPLADVAARFDAPLARSRQTSARRLLAEVETLFPGSLARRTLPDGTAVVQLEAVSVGQLPAATTAEIVALTQAVALLGERGEVASARSLETLRRALVAKLRIDGQRLHEADVEVLLEGRHLLARPGPRSLMQAETFGVLSDALLAVTPVAFDYTRDGVTARHEVEAWGIIAAGRAYLVARMAGRRSGEPTRWRLDRIGNVALLPGSYAIPEDFDLAAYARRSFGSFYNTAEYGEVVWRFAPHAAEAAAGFDFHPDQRTEREPDGSLVVRFRAAGHLEMAWFLYQWGDAVEVVEPAALRAMVEGHRRDDFPALP